MTALLRRVLRRETPPGITFPSTFHPFSTTSNSLSRLRSKYAFVSPPSLHPPTHKENTNVRPEHVPRNIRRLKNPYRPPSSLDRSEAPTKSELPFEFRFSYTESSQNSRPIGLRGPKHSPFGPGRLDRVWTGVCAPAVDPKAWSTGIEDELEEKKKIMRDSILGEPLTNAERKVLAERCQRPYTKKQINLGRDGLTHNMLNVIHNHWKSSEAVRIKCMGVPTVDMKYVCAQLEDKTCGKIIHRHCGLLVLYRGRYYKPQDWLQIPLMLWKPQEPVYPRLIKTTVDGLSIEETKELRKRGLSVPPLTKLAKNGYYGSLIPMVRDAFLSDELVRIDCQGLPKSDYKKLGCKLRDLVPCILVTFEKEQIVVWRGKNYNPAEGGHFLMERETFDDPNADLSEDVNGDDSSDFNLDNAGINPGDSDDE